MQTNKWICLKTRCVSCGFFSGFCGILVLGIMILEAVMGAEGQNRRAKVENEAWCFSVLMAFGRGAGSRGNTAAAGGNPPLSHVLALQVKHLPEGKHVLVPPQESLFVLFVDVLLLFQVWQYRSWFSSENVN